MIHQEFDGMPVTGHDLAYQASGTKTCVISLLSCVVVKLITLARPATGFRTALCVVVHRIYVLRLRSNDQYEIRPVLTDLGNYIGMERAKPVAMCFKK